MEKNEITTRRLFIKKSALSTTGSVIGLKSIGKPSIASAQRNRSKIRMGFIGVGNRGTQLLKAFMGNSDVEITALCDVYQPYLTRNRSQVNRRFLDELGDTVPPMGETFPNKVEKYTDFRKLIENKNIEAVCIATPDHWHAIQTIMALEAGKDVYVEKPLTITIHEGRKMVEAARRTDRVVQVGLNRRSSSIYRELAELVRKGTLGKVTVSRAYRISNMYPDGIGTAAPEEPPEGFDWDMWLGPRAYRPYQYNIAPYKFRWWKSYSTQMGNWGVHYLDLIRWLTGETAPVAVTAHGGQYVLKDDRTIPDTMDVIFEFESGAIALFGIYEANGGSALSYGEVELRGTRATLCASLSGYQIKPNGGGQFQSKETHLEPVDKRLELPEDTTAGLVRNFLDCVKSREKCICDLETGHRSTTFAHLANIALETGSRIEWDSKRERIINNKKANELLHYTYRKPWTLG
ncbi:MAG: Gfo/Idh/MocA family oxidoreductase [Candidatus Latescibacteria bacterium]|nr:Gfo/Idh/MocA family oxidoreductase [Candidatus Latescibacterota bacterium]